jgi:hypothetical protein
LKSQVKEKTLQKLSGHPKMNDVLNDEDIHGQYTFDEPDTEIIPVLPHEKRLCMVNKTKQNLSIDINDPESMIRRSIDDVSAEKLLEASLMSLETIGRQRASHKGHQQGNINERMSSNINNDDTFPSEKYLSGALWIGRNLTLIVEELADSLDNYRNKHLMEVAAASNDHDFKRSSHRLNLLAGAGITEALSLTNTTRTRARNILQGAASIFPGDSQAFKAYLKLLPIEAAIDKADNAPSSPHQTYKLKRSKAWE